MRVRFPGHESPKREFKDEGILAKALKGAFAAEKAMTDAVVELISGREAQAAEPGEQPGQPASPGSQEGDSGGSAKSTGSSPIMDFLTGKTADERINRIRKEVEAEKNKYSIYLDKQEKGIFTEKALTPEQSHAGIGSLSSRYESNGNPGAVNENDVGGAAYGSYQMHSSGTVGAFVKNSPWAKEFEGLKPGSKPFTAKWKEIAARDGQAFGDAQHESIKQTHYAPMVEAASKMGIDVSSNKMLQDVMWSTGVQHGTTGGPEILSQALAGVDPKTLTPMQIKNRIYAERGRKDMNGNLVHFPRVKGAAAQSGLVDRFTNESRDATAMAYSSDNLATITPAKLPTPTPISKPAEHSQSASSSPGPWLPGQGAGGANAGGWSPPQIDRRANPPRQQSQPRRAENNIPMEFDDTLLTLMVHDLM